MAYPPGVQLATLTFSNPSTFLGGEAARSDVTVEASASVVWSATGQPIDNFEENVSPGGGLPGSLTVPFVDQPGFTDQSGNAFTNWAYTVTRRTTFGNKTKMVRKNWQPVLGQGTVDFDTLPGGPIGLPVSAPVVPVTSVGGFTGAVTAEQLASALPASGQGIQSGGELAALGDSLTDMDNPGSLLGARETAGAVTHHERSWLGHTLRNIGGRYRYGGVFATPGLTAAQVRDAHLADVIARKPQVCVVLAGANGAEDPGTKQALADIWSGLAAAGIAPILCTIMPRNAGTPTTAGVVADLNAYIVKYAADHGHLCANVYGATVDPATGEWPAGWALDGTHPEAVGAEAAGLAIADVINAAVPAPLAPLARAAIAEESLVPNPLFMLPPDGNGYILLSGYGTSVHELVDRAGVPGKVLKLTCGDTSIIFRSDPIALTPGRRYSFAAMFGATATVAQGFNFGIESSDAGGFLLRYADTVGTAQFGPNVWEFDYPAGQAVDTWCVQVWSRGEGTVVELAQVTLRDIGPAL